MKYIYLAFMVLIFSVQCSGKSSIIHENDDSIDLTTVSEPLKFKNEHEFRKYFKSRLKTESKDFFSMASEVHLLDDVKIQDFNRNISILLIQCAKTEEELKTSIVDNFNNEKLKTEYTRINSDISGITSSLREIAQNRNWEPDLRVLDKFISYRLDLIKNLKLLEDVEIKTQKNKKPSPGAVAKLPASK